MTRNQRTMNQAEKWRETMRKKHGVDDEGLSQIMRERQKKSMQHPNRQKGVHRGGFFYASKEQRKEYGRQGAHKRWGNRV